MKFLPLLLLPLLCGCSSLSKCLRELAHDTNRVHVVIVTPWGHATIDRNHP
jgi:hypothetical protein